MPCFVFSLKYKNLGETYMPDKKNFNYMKEIFLYYTRIIRNIRVRDLEDEYEKRDDYIRALNESQEICDEIEAALDEKHKKLLMKFCDLLVDMEIRKSFIFYMHGFDDCQMLYELFRDCSNGKLHLPIYDEFDGFIDEYINIPDTEEEVPG
jgi:hypothetical protein